MNYLQNVNIDWLTNPDQYADNDMLGGWTTIVNSTGASLFILGISIVVAVFVVKALINSIQTMVGGSRGKEESKVNWGYLIMGLLLALSIAGIVTSAIKIAGAFNKEMLDTGSSSATTEASIILEPQSCLAEMDINELLGGGVIVDEYIL